MCSSSNNNIGVIYYTSVLVTIELFYFIFRQGRAGPGSGQVRSIGPDPMRAGPTHQKSGPTLALLGPGRVGPRANRARPCSWTVYSWVVLGPASCAGGCWTWDESQPTSLDDS
jgi:hypothetical protein